MSLFRRVLSSYDYVMNLFWVRDHAKQNPRVPFIPKTGLKFSYPHSGNPYIHLFSSRENSMSMEIRHGNDYWIFEIKLSALFGRVIIKNKLKFDPEGFGDNDAIFFCVF